MKSFHVLFDTFSVFLLFVETDMWTGISCYIIAYVLTIIRTYYLNNSKNLAIANRLRVSCINTNNNTMTLKSGLEVTQGH